MDETAALITINYPVFFGLILTFLAGLKGLISLLEWFGTKFGIETNGMRKRREEHELLIATSESLNSLSKTVNALALKHDQDIAKLYEDNLKYRDQSREIKNDLKNNIESISAKLDQMTERNNKRIRAELKDRIGQSYRHYHLIGKINDMELNALEDLIESYELADGDNSFVHSVVQKEMYTWEKIERT